jgi:hypothetical protein
MEKRWSKRAAQLDQLGRKHERLADMGRGDVDHVHSATKRHSRLYCAVRCRAAT